MTYRFMVQHQHEFDIAMMCEALGVSRSGYYAWLKGGPMATIRSESGRSA